MIAKWEQSFFLEKYRWRTNIINEVFFERFFDSSKGSTIRTDYRSQRKVRISRWIEQKSSIIELFFSSADSLILTQSLKLENELNIHKGCVNSIVWNNKGDRILSGSDDQKLIMTNPFTSEVYLKFITGHRSNIFSAKFLPQSECKVISCAGNGSVLVSDDENNFEYRRYLWKHNIKLVETSKS